MLQESRGTGDYDGSHIRLWHGLYERLERGVHLGLINKGALGTLDLLEIRPALCRDLRSEVTHVGAVFDRLMTGKAQKNQGKEAEDRKNPQSPEDQFRL